MGAANRHCFKEFRNVEWNVNLPNGENLAVKGIGTVRIEIYINSEYRTVVLTNVRYTPELKQQYFQR